MYYTKLIATNINKIGDFLNVFSSRDSAVGVHILSDNSTGIPSGQAYNPKLSHNASSSFWSILNSPTSDVQIINKRRQTLLNLSKAPTERQTINEKMDQIIIIAEDLKYLLKVDFYEEKKKNDPTYEGPIFKRIEQLQEFYKAEGLDLSEFISNPPAIKLNDDYLNNCHQKLMNCVKQIDVISEISHAMSEIKDPVFNVLAKQLDSFQYKSLLRQALIGISKGDLDAFKDSKRILKAVNDIVPKIQALVMIASLVKQGLYNEVTFKVDQKEVYKNAYHNKRERKKSSFRDEFTQIANDSPEDIRLVTLTGDMMSGKSFNLEMDIDLRSMAQSIGFASCDKDANFHLKAAFIKIDRAITDAANSRSAYAEDALNLKKLFDLLEKYEGQDVQLSIDEWGSTTSPEDQAYLIITLYEILSQTKSRVTLATHNDLYINYMKKTAPESLYHMAVEDPTDGKINWLHKLMQGTAPSHNIEIAKQLGLPSRIIDLISAYYSKNIPLVNVPELSITPVIAYTDAEREEMKQLPSSFRVIMPHLDEVVVHMVEDTNYNYSTGEDVKIEYPQMYWHYRDLHPGENDLRKRPEYMPFFFNRSSDEDFNYFHLYGDDVQDVADIIRSMILNGPVLSSQEILERQNMFEELINNDNFEKFDNIWNAIFDLHTSITNHYHLSHVYNHLHEFNTYAFEHAKKSLMKHIQYGYYADEHMLNSFRLFIKIIEYNLSKVEKSLSDLNIGDQIKKIEEFITAAAAFKALEGKMPWGERKTHPEKMEQWQADRWHYSTIKKNINPDLKGEEFVKSSIQSIYDLVKEFFKPISLWDYDLDLLDVEIYEMYDEMKCVLKYGFGEASDVFYVLRNLIDKTDHRQEFEDLMNQYDSAYMNQLLLYLKPMISIFMGELRNGRQFLEKLKLNYAEDDDSRLDHTEGLNISCDHNQEEIFRYEVRHLFSLIIYAHFMKTEGYSKVSFNETGEISIQGAWDPAAMKKEVTPNDFNMNVVGDTKQERTKILSGFHMSGKSTSKKHLTRILTGAHMTGFASAKSATMPILNGVANLDRIKAKTDKGLSAGGTETKARKELFDFIEGRPLVFIGDDETYSTIPPSYQSAFTSGIAHYLLENGHYYMLAHHNHDFILGFHDKNEQFVRVMHLKTHYKGAELIFDYELVDGHQHSHALEVAEAMGLPKHFTDKVRENMKTIKLR